VVLVTHSQGAFIAWSTLSRDGPSNVASLVMLAPFDQGLAPYPRAGHGGAGAGGGVAVRLITSLGRDVGISHFDPDAPLARELQATSGAIGRLTSRRIPPTVRAEAILARGDLPLEPKRWPRHLTETCPGWLLHAGLPSSGVVLADADAFLDGRSEHSRCPVWVRALGHATDAFGAPPPSAG
jgi:pimeloyl-ACP methyl ester carboxylesterase